MVELLHKDVTEKIISAAFEVHNILGPGLIESVYETALDYELKERGLSVARQREYRVPYKEIIAGGFFVDFLVEGKVIVELKATSEHHKVFESQLLYYLKALRIRVGLLLNFGMESLFRKRFVV
jgi:GxxExxY protein